MSSKVKYLHSKNIAFRHGYFMRFGGVSPKPYDTLNVAIRTGDTKGNVIENRKRALAALNLRDENLAFLDELEHGDKILSVSDAAKGLDFDGYDAIMTNSSEVVLGVSVADCAVILLASEKDGAIALAHSGWRGTYANIVPKVIEAMIEEYGVDPKNLNAVIGPHHTVDTYEFGPEASEYFEDRYIEKRDDTHFLNMRLAIQDQLTESGVKSIDDFGVNTFTDERFFSYRRDNGDTGRNIVLATL